MTLMSADFDDGAQAAGPGLQLERRFGDGLERFLLEDEVHPVVREELVVLLGERVLGLGEDGDQVCPGEADGRCR